MQLFKELQNYVQHQLNDDVAPDRRPILNSLVDVIKQKILVNKEVAINFVCTHNSRRSQFAQFWATLMASYFDVQHISCFSSGVEVTALHANVVDIFKNIGERCSN